MDFNHIRPPKWADRFLQWYCRSDLLEEIQGDIYELFDNRCQKKGLTSAKRLFVWDVLRSFRLSTIKSIHMPSFFYMFRSNVKIAWRHLLKQKYHSLINVGGLAIGIACCLFIWLYINHELSYDSHYEKADRIYRVLSESSRNGKDRGGVYHNPPFAEVAIDMFPEVENAFRLRTMNSQLVKVKGQTQNIYEERFIYADQSMLDILQIPLKYGELATALKEPNSIVLSERKAKAYFFDENPVGQVIFLDNNMDRPYQITGVLDKVSTPSHIQFDFYLSMEGLAESKSGSWTRSSYITYFLLAPETNIPRLEQQLMTIANTYKKEDIEGAKKLGSPYGFRYKLQAISDIYLHSEHVKIYGNWTKGDVRYIWLMGTIAILILIIAAINFVNLSTAKSANRAKEVGIRKVLGSFQSQLIGQFLTESMILSLLGIFVGLFLSVAFMPLFQDLPGLNVGFPWEKWRLLSSLLAIGIIVGLIAGLYPAFYLSSFMPVKVLKGKLNLGSKGGTLRSILVVGQFTGSIVLIISSIIVYQQMNYIQQKKLGFDKEQVLILEDTYSLRDKKMTFKEALKKIPEIESVSFSSYVPVRGYESNGSTFQHPDTSRGIEEVELRRWFIDEDYIPTLDMNLIKGRNFSGDFSLDTASIILNESAVKMLGFEDPLGKQLTMNRTYTVIGVVEDFHFRSMKQPIIPLGFHRGDVAFANTTLVKTNTADFKSVLSKLTETWHTFAPDQALRYNFLDAQFLQMYETERKTGKIFTAFAGLAILIACLGLFALATFMAEQRMKEICIRKVLGASMGQIFGLISYSFLRLVLIAILLAIPIGWFFMQNWLQDFAYRIEVNLNVFCLAGFIALVIALFTISYQALKAAYSNPADELRAE